MFKCKPKKCDLSERGEYYVRKYIRFMESRGVKFNNTPKDKELFLKLYDEYGSEYEVTRAHYRAVEVSTWLSKDLVERVKKLGKVGDIARKAIEKGLSILERETMEEKSENVRQEPSPEPVYTHEDWICSICGAMYQLFHVSHDQHKITLVKEGKVADSKTSKNNNI